MPARATRLAWQDLPLDRLLLPEGELLTTLGFGSGLTCAAGRVFAVTDRGPNLFISQAMELGLSHLAPLLASDGAKVMPWPEQGPEIVALRVADGALRVEQRMQLRTRSGQRLSGAVPAGATMEALFGLTGASLAASPLGADTEAIAALPDGGFFVAEEYVPSLLKVDAQGMVTERWVPAGLEAGVQHPDIVVRSVLPERIGRRRLNRGIEALCASPDGRHLYVGLQSAPEDEDARFAPVWMLDVETGACVGEYRYPFDAPETFRRDAQRRRVGEADLKICEFAWLAGERLLVLERIAHTTKLYAFDPASGGKALVLSSDDVPEIGPDMEGMTLVSDREILLVSDNDFGVEGAATEAWLVTLDRAI